MINRGQFSSLKKLDFFFKSVYWEKKNLAEFICTLSDFRINFVLLNIFYYFS